MSPITHFLVGWMVANSVELNPRERMMVTVAGVIPDIDGLGLIVELPTRHSAHPLMWWSEYHHLLGHNLAFGVIVTAVCFAFARKRWTTAALVFLSFHLHLFCDIIGARGPDGNQWPIPYLWPFSSAWQLAWSGQWLLNAWQNFVITGVALVITFYWAWRRGFSPLEIFSKKLDRIFVEALRRRFPQRT